MGMVDSHTTVYSLSNLSLTVLLSSCSDLKIIFKSSDLTQIHKFKRISRTNLVRNIIHHYSMGQLSYQE